MSVKNYFFCTDLAWEYGLSLIGTATRGDIWFLLEYSERWGAKAFEESTLEPEVRAHLQAAHHPRIESRILLIKQDRTQIQEGFRFFVAQTQSLNPRLYEYHLADYRDLLNIDIATLATGQPGDPHHLRDKPLYLVCANGKRDQCCARYGPEIYQALQAEAERAVWQSSHIGGHNQAPIMLFFPHGVNYAHATPSEALRLMHAYQQGKIVLHHYRGRVCFDPPAQAAEYFWREQTGNLDLPGIQIESVTEINPKEWNITVSGTDGKNAIAMQIQRQVSDYEIPITCTKKKTAPVSSFHRIA